MNFFVVSRGYLQIFPDRLRLLVPADSRDVEKTGAFSRPDRLLADFALAEALLREAILDAYSSWADPRPVLLVHPKVLPEKGLSEHDKRLLLALARGAGARQCALWTGDDPTPEDMARLAPL